MNDDSQPARTTIAPRRSADLIHYAVLGSFLFAAALTWAKLISPLPSLEQTNWPDALLLLTATAAALSSVSRTLAFQYVAWGALVIGVLGGTAHAIGTLALIPFGPFVYTSAAGPKIFGVLPWMVPLLWIVFIYTSRGVARLILQPWRWTRHYGFWLIGITALLSTILDLSFDPWAAGRKHFWIWELTRFPYTWKGTPLTNFAGWLATSTVLMAFVTPLLINKQPGAKPVRESGSLIIWLSLNVVFITALIRKTSAH
ncbi:MAG: carotenoid biosynthesis protein [Akkermansiaceae bacterium]|nr:carotenoid biosynthesis protein [Verrucomicrobiales bacterium]